MPLYNPHCSGRLALSLPTHSVQQPESLYPRTLHPPLFELRHRSTTMAPTRQQRARQEHVLEAARFAALCSRPSSPPDAPVSDELLTPTSARYHRARAPRPEVRTASVVGIGCDMIFAPTGMSPIHRFRSGAGLTHRCPGCFSIPLVTNKSDPRPIDWMFTTFEDIKPLSVVREELLQASKVKDAKGQTSEAEPICLFGLSGRRLFPGESPPF